MPDGCCGGFPLNKVPPYPGRAYAWVVVAALIIASLVAFVDRQVVAIVVDPMKEDLGVGDTQIGWLYGVFAIFYAVAAVPIAWLSDRKSRKHIIACGIFFWSLLTMACGLSRNFWYIFLARIGVGVGEATLSPAAMSLIGDHFPRRLIPLAVSVFQTGAIVGSGLAFIIGGAVLGMVAQAEPLVLPIAGELKPWQQTFVYLGAPGLLLAFLFLLIREPARRPVGGSEVGAGSSAALIGFYRQHTRTLLFHHLGFLSLALMGYGFVFWTVTFFVRVHGMDAAEASTIFGWIFLLFGPMGPICVALLAAYLGRRGRRDANLVAGMVGGALTLPLVLLIQFAPDATWAFVFYAPAMLAVNSPFGIATGALPVITPPPLRARVAAVYMLVVSAGMMLGPPIAGAFNEYLFPEAEGVRYSMISLTCLFGVTGVVLLWFGRKPYGSSMEQADSWAEPDP